MWGKEWSGPHSAWLLTSSGYPVRWETRLPGVVQTAVAAVSREQPKGSYTVIIFDNEAEIDKVVAWLNGDLPGTGDSTESH